MITKIKIDPGFTVTEPTVVTLNVSGPFDQQAREIARIVADAPSASTDVDTTGIGYVLSEHIQNEINKIAAERAGHGS